MKTIIVAAIFLLFLGIVGTLLLENDNRRFAGSLPQPTIKEQAQVTVESGKTMMPSAPPTFESDLPRKHPQSADHATGS